MHAHHVQGLLTPSAFVQDGSWRGYLRTNAAGNNLNRCWKEPTLAESPEVYFTQRKMRETGVDMCIGAQLCSVNVLCPTENQCQLEEHS